MNEKDEIKVEDAMAVLNDEPTISQRLDKLEKMMEQILLRLPSYTTSGYAHSSQPIWTTGSTCTAPYTVTTTASTNTITFVAGPDQ